ncbi:CRTAC1 family protein [Novipirellula artificiosorum]|uniref:ASPIC and UnbV n=1 Tax=Novipirellula artificiosorum TaxID=2528016 RepID=A0A5C6DB75_9BACT|nr:CRTAC1 family protein [Novipirellula artificiosorum]TWU32991.1 ASPIC and UnbV [Novipirellula artificiosorum]
MARWLVPDSHGKYRIVNPNPDHDPRDLETEHHDDAVIGRAFRSSLAAIVALFAVGGGIAYLVSRPEPPPELKQTRLAPVRIREMPKVEIPTVSFTDVTKEVGIDFVHNNGATGEKLLPETMGGGCAAFDFDNDGDQDILFVNSKDWPQTPSGNPPSTMGLYRNDGGKFTNVTVGSGLDVSCYGMGTAVGDYDNDGWVDVFITALGPNHLFRNLGDGHFEEVTSTAGLAGADDAWSCGAGWFDYDNDSDLDLFVGNYVKWTRDYDVSQNFQLVGGGRAYGRPQNFEGVFPYFYRNDGGGKFSDISEQAGVQVRNPATGVEQPKSLGVTICDVDDNGTLDLIVANDTVQNLLFNNTGDGKFQEYGVLSGIAFDSGGNARGAMGIDVTPFRDNKAIAIAIGNFANEMTAMFVSRKGKMQFFDEAVSTGLGPSTRLELTFGIFYFDYDLDGRVDLFCANGHLEDEINRVQPSQHYEQPPQLFWNAGAQYGTEFLKVNREHCGDDLLQPMVGRGAVYLDYDLDGDLDVLITSVGRKPRLLRNELTPGQHWLRLKLVGDGSAVNRDAIGAWAEVIVGEKTYRKQVMPTRSYLSQVELPVTFGLGDTDQVENVVVQWPDGRRQEFGPLQVDQVHRLVR